MNPNLKVSKNIIISASTQKLWEVLTKPELIKVYLFGTKTTTDWKVNSSIVFQGEFNGHAYKDKGIVVKNELFEILQYRYWSGFSGLEDLPENYSLVTYSIESINSAQLRFTWTQEGFASEEGQQHLDNGLEHILNQIKELAEAE